MLDSAHEAFRKNEERLQRMEDRPSEYVRRQVRATPYPHEDTGWTIANAGDDVCMFSSDFPHVEGGRNPIGRFERSIDAAGIDDNARRRFYWDNFVDLLRPVLERRGLPVAEPVSPYRRDAGGSTPPHSRRFGRMRGGRRGGARRAPGVRPARSAPRS